jgi:hypothetical protein
MTEKNRAAQRIDDAVDMTFPASDPPAPGTTTGTEPAAKRPIDRKPPRMPLNGWTSVWPAFCPTLKTPAMT